MCTRTRVLLAAGVLLFVHAPSWAGQEQPGSVGTLVSSFVEHVTQGDPQQEDWEERMRSARRRSSNGKKTILIGVPAGVALMFLGNRVSDSESGAKRNLALVWVGSGVAAATGFVGAMNYTRGSAEMERLEAEGRDKGYLALDNQWRVSWEWTMGW